MGWFTRDNTRRGRLVLALLFGALGTVVACRDDAVPTRVAGPPSGVSVVSGPPNQQDWRHCENDKDPASACNWTTGNLNETHNLYYEGWYVPHVLRIPDIVDTGPDTLVMTYGFKKGGHHTFDFLGVWNASLANANVCTESRYADFCTGPVSSTTPPAMRAISASTPAGSLAAALVAGASAACGATFADSLATAITRAEAGGPAIALRGIDLAAIGVADATLDGCGADVEATIRIVLTPAPGVTSALLLVGAHISRTRDWMGGGATMVPGSPYHLGLISINGISTGSMDLQMQSNAIQPMGRVMLIKQTLGDVGSFDFTRTDGDEPNPIPATFSMSTGTPGSASSGVDTLLFEDVPLGTQVVTESAPPTGWALTALSCTDPSGNSSVSLASRAATIVVDDSELIVCTFTNTAAGAIRVVKTAVGGDSTFSFTPTGFGSGAFALTTVSGSADSTFAGLVAATSASGTYRLSETALSGWAAGTMSCLREDGTTSAGDPATGIT
ncbi:MAG: prealbumin-like fold domain-containing protein, partial [Gemmatimonadaceae bacterium]